MLKTTKSYGGGSGALKDIRQIDACEKYPENYRDWFAFLARYRMK